MFFYVYILTDRTTNTHHYTGFTTNLLERLQKHNEGGVPSTAAYKPWRIDTAIAFTNEQKARNFEIYLKSHSGRAFTERHFENSQFTQAVILHGKRSENPY